MKNGIEIYAVSGYQYDGTKSIRPHQHPVFQIYYVVTGSTYYTLNEIKYYVRAGEFIIIPPDAQHGQPLADKGLSVLDIKFDVLNKELQKDIQALGPVIHNNSEGIELAFGLIEMEAREKKVYYDRVVGLQLETIFYILLQALNTDATTACREVLAQLNVDFNQLSNCTKRVLHHVEGDIVWSPEPVDLDVISASVGYSRRHVCSQFSKEIGISVLQYMALLRIDKAKELLTKSNKRVKEISQMLGFRDVSYFIRFFKKYTGFSPKAYRVKQNNISNERYYAYTFRSFGGSLKKEESSKQEPD